MMYLKSMLFMLCQVLTEDNEENQITVKYSTAFDISE